MGDRRPHTLHSLILVLCLFVSVMDVTGHLQNMTFFSGTNCDPISLQETVFVGYFSDRTENLNSMIPYARSAIIYGVWSYWIKDMRFGNQTLGWLYQPFDPYHTSCNKGTPWLSDPDGDYYTYIFVVRRGPSDLSVSSLTLYPQENFAGPNFTEITSASVSFPAPIDVNSLLYTGRTGWTLYSKPDFSGEVMTLSPDSDPYSTTKVRYLNILHDVTVGSVRMGIHSNESVDDAWSLDEGIDLVTSWSIVVDNDDPNDRIMPMDNDSSIMSSNPWRYIFGHGGLFAPIVMAFILLIVYYMMARRGRSRSTIKHEKLVNEF